MPATHYDLINSWELHAVEPDSKVPAGIRDTTVPATVPGCVHTDLLAAGLIDDPYLDDNELKLVWIGRTTWRYTCRFEVDPNALKQEHVDLVCEGLDTIATLTLNGKEIGRTASMHLRHRFNVKKLLQAGMNTLTITFAAPINHAEARCEAIGELPHIGNGSNPAYPHNFIRKMACNFGWDWGPVVPTSGIWRPIYLQAWSTARLGDVRPLVTKANESKATVQLHADIVGDSGAKLHATLTGPHGGTVELQPGSHVLTVDKPELWWPVGHGNQPLYELEVTLIDGRGETLDHKLMKIGLRTTELELAPDPEVPSEGVEGLEQGTSMTIKINGKPIFCKGANWIPDDCFPTRVDRSRYRQRIEQARSANMNMLRVWGGGTFESADFYELCDELGIMVWQDFLCACALYVETDEFPTLLEAEARDNVSRLARHPSLVLWNGCNENIWGAVDWKWEGKRWIDFAGDRGWGLKYYFETFPSVIAELDPSRPYWPGSPSNGTPDPTENDPNANRSGNRHVWNVWHGPGQYRNYLAHFPRFASEFGFHGPPNWPTLERSIPEDQRHWHSDLMLLHNKNQVDNGVDGQQKSHNRMGDDFVQPEGPDDFDDWLYLAQVVQGRALSMGCEWFRALAPWCQGSLYWQLNDCYPVSSWSAIDGDGRAKPLLFATRRFYAPRLLTIKPRAVTPTGDDIGKLAVYAHNDHAEDFAGEVRLRLLGLDGEERATETLELDVPANGSARLDVPDAWHDRLDQGYLVAECESDVDDAWERGLWWPQPDKEMQYAPAEFTTDVKKADHGYDVTISATSLVRDLCLFADRLDPDAEVSDQLITLLPGESVTLNVITTKELDADALKSVPVLQAVNRFGGS